jgi:hypothetical protein
MGQPYTHGVWKVKPSREEEFVAAWTELAEWTAREVPGSRWAIGSGGLRSAGEPAGSRPGGTRG